MSTATSSAESSVIAASLEGDVNAPGNTINPEFHEQMSRTLERAIERLCELQHDDGHWCAELEGDSILQSEFILTIWIIGLEDHPDYRFRLKKIATYLRQQQLPSGAWAQYPGGTLGGGAMDISATVKGYFALKLMGDDTNAPHMLKAKKMILDHGGAERINSFSKYYLAALGQVSYNAVPYVPCQIKYLPKWFYFHLDKVSAWSRTMIIPLAIVTNQKARRELPEEMGIGYLFKDQANRNRLLSTGFGASRFWTGFFLTADKCLKWADKLKLTRIGQKRALKWMEDWLVQRCEGSDGPGAIFPPIVYQLIAFIRCREYSPDHPLMQRLLKHLDDYFIYGLTDEKGQRTQPRNQSTDAQLGDDTIRLQPCESPVWDTGIAAYALTDCGLDAGTPYLRKCVDWLLSKECKQKGDWKNNVPEEVAFTGWFFEYNNQWYPDVDDTVMVSMALKRLASNHDGEVVHDEALAASARSFEWVRAMQNTDGGWAAFDKGTQGRDILECVPFADHNALQDPSCPDITGRTLECWGNHGVGHDDPNVKRAIKYMRDRQEPEGCWFGRWGVNYIYGTWQVVGGLWQVGYNMNERWVRRAGEWLKSVQKEDGSFGETCDSYEDRSLMGQGESTASQTAWGGMAMMAIYGPEDSDVQRAIKWLCETQLDLKEDGSPHPERGNWDEPWFTGTGFPKVFYLRYHMYRLYFPIMFLGRWRRLIAEGKDSAQ